MRANANATILNRGTAIENPEIKKEVQTFEKTSLTGLLKRVG